MRLKRTMLIPIFVLACIRVSHKHHCATLKKALGEVLHKEYIAVKRSEWRGFYNKDPEWEIEKHVYVY